MATGVPSHPGAHFEFSIPGYERVSVGLSRFGAKLADFRGFFREYVAPKFFDDVRRNIELEGAYVGRWPALSQPYAAWKARAFPDKGLMRRTDRLYRSFEFEQGQVGPGGIFRLIGLRSAELGTTVHYALYHQDGTARMPQRRLLFLPKGSRENYGRLLHRWAVDEQKRAGLQTSPASAWS